MGQILKLKIPWREYDVIEQPEGQVGCVDPHAVTRFQWAKLGFLGESKTEWLALQEGDVIKVDDESFRVTEKRVLQVVDATHFKLEDGTVIDSNQVFEMFYGDFLTLQTCLGGVGGARLFVRGEKEMNIGHLDT